jgi:hypothetical protein
LVVAEVGRGDLQAEEQHAGALEVHLVGGDPLQHVSDGVLDGFAILGM